MNAPYNQLTDNSDEIDLLALVGTLIDYRWLIVSVTGVFAIVGIAYALLATPVYRANALVQVEEKSSGVAGLEEMSDLFSQQSQAVTEIEIIKSRMVVGRAVDKLKLDITAEPRYFPFIGRFIARHFSPGSPDDIAAPWLGLDSFDWGGSDIEVFQLDVPDRLLGETLELKVEEDGRYSMSYEGDMMLRGQVGKPAKGHGITLQIKTLKALPGMTFDLVRRNRLKTIMDYQQSLSASERGKQSGMISLALENEEPAFARQVLDEIANIYVQQNVKRMSAEAANSLAFLKKQLPQVRKDMEKAENKLNNYQISAKSADITIETQAVLDQIVDLETSLSDLRLKQLEMDKRFTREHPAYQALLDQISALEHDKKQLEDKVANLPEIQQELLRLKRDVEVSSQIYTQLLQKTQELDIARASTVGNVRVIDTAAVDTSNPVAPKRKLIVVIATLLGGMLSVAIALVHSLINRGVENPVEIEALDLPVYATIPFSDLQIDTKKSNERNEKSLPLLARAYPAEPCVEALRSLHTSLHFAMLEADNNIMMMSGPSPKVGKSFVSVNLATVMAEAGKKILLIDADMRKGYIHKFFDNNNEVGLSALLAKRAELQQALIHTGVENLDVITRGHIPPNPSDLLLTNRFNELLDEVQPQYDLIIIDTPPILAVADAVTVAKRAATNFIVVRFGENPINEIKATIRRFENNGITLNGAILNATRKKAMNYYKYGYDSYQYSYSDDLTVKGNG